MTHSCRMTYKYIRICAESLKCYVHAYTVLYILMCLVLCCDPNEKNLLRTSRVWLNSFALKSKSLQGQKNFAVAS